MEFTSALKHLPYCWRCRRSWAGYLNLHTDISASRDVNSVKCSFIWPVLKWKDVTWWGLCSFLKLPVRFQMCCCKVSVQAADTCSTAYSWLLLNPQLKEERATSPNFPMLGKLCACWFLRFHSQQLIFCMWVLEAGGGTNKNTYMLSSGALFGAVSSVLLLLELNKKIVRKLSLHVIITEFQKWNLLLGINVLRPRWIRSTCCFNNIESSGCKICFNTVLDVIASQ